MKRITLCADDFGMHPDISNAIAHLIQQKRVQATSCLVTSDYWGESAHLISDIRQSADIGLHLNFTEGKGLSQAFRDGLPSLGKMLIKSHLRQLNHQHLAEEIQSQFEAFATATGHLPDFVDGHQHVHHLPQVREALFQVLANYSLPERFWVRSVDPMLITASTIKSHVIVHSGARSLRKQLQGKSLFHNKAFAGVYSLAPKQPFARYIRQWFCSLPDISLIMCHPAKATSIINVDHAEARLQEYHYLLGNDFTSDCANNKVKLTRLSECF